MENKQQMLEKIKADSSAIMLASDELQNDPDFIAQAIPLCPFALMYAGEKAKTYDNILASVKIFGNMLEYASQDLRDNKQIVLAAVKQNGCSIKFSSRRLRDDREIVLTAMRQDVRALMYVSDEPRNVYEIMLEAVKINGIAINYASYRLKRNNELKSIAMENYYGTEKNYAQIVLGDWGIDI